VATDDLIARIVTGLAADAGREAPALRSGSQWLAAPGR
jgi:hypothetical protein